MFNEENPKSETGSNPPDCENNVKYKYGLKTKVSEYQLLENLVEKSELHTQGMI